MSRCLLRYAVTVLAVSAGAALINIGASTPRVLAAYTPAEDWVLQHLEAGELADLATEPQRSISSSFLADLLTNSIPGVHVGAHGVRIAHATIVGDLELTNTDIATDISLTDSMFESIRIMSVHFKQNLVFDRSTFGMAQLGRVTVDGNTSFSSAHFTELFDFRDSVVAGQLSLIGSQFDNDVSFDELSTKRALVLDGSTFASAVHLIDTDLYQLQARQDQFDGDFDANGSKVTKHGMFSGSTFYGNVVLSDVTFGGQLDVTSVRWPDPSRSVYIGGMTYRDIFAGSNAWSDVKSFFDRTQFYSEAYVDLEAYYKRLGRLEDADAVFVERKRHERRNPVQAGVEAVLPAVWDALVLDEGLCYGRCPARVVYVSLAIVLVGAWVFHPARMDPVDRAGRRPYSRFWYSLDVFAPVISLQARDHWAPKKTCPKTLGYMRLQTLAGWLLVPLGVAALTGLVK